MEAKFEAKFEHWKKTMLSNPNSFMFETVEIFDGKFKCYVYNSENVPVIDCYSLELIKIEVGIKDTFEKVSETLDKASCEECVECKFDDLNCICCNRCVLIKFICE